MPIVSKLHGIDFFFVCINFIKLKANHKSNWFGKHLKWCFRFFFSRVCLKLCDKRAKVLTCIHRAHFHKIHALCGIHADKSLKIIKEIRTNALEMMRRRSQHGFFNVSNLFHKLRQSIHSCTLCCHFCHTYNDQIDRHVDDTMLCTWCWNNFPSIAHERWNQQMICILEICSQCKNGRKLLAVIMWQLLTDTLSVHFCQCNSVYSIRTMAESHQRMKPLRSVAQILRRKEFSHCNFIYLFQSEIKWTIE